MHIRTSAPVGLVVLLMVALAFAEEPSFDNALAEELLHRVKSAGVSSFVILAGSDELTKKGCSRMILWNRAAERVYPDIMTTRPTGYCIRESGVNHPDGFHNYSTLVSRFGIRYEQTVLYEVWSPELRQDGTAGDKGQVVMSEEWSDDGVIVRRKGQKQAQNPASRPLREAASSTLSQDRQRLAHIAGYLDLIGSVVGDRDKKTGEYLRNRATMMRERVRELGMPQAEAVDYIQRGVREAMNDHNEGDGSRIARKVTTYEEEGLTLLIKHFPERQ